MTYGKVCYSIPGRKSEKWQIGNNEFNRVMCAAYLLYELYGMDYGYVDRNGDFIDPVRCIAWINHVLDKDFTAEKRFNLWKYYESYYFTEIEQDHYDRAYPKTVFGIIPEALRGGMGGRDLADIYYIVYGTGIWDGSSQQRIISV